MIESFQSFFGTSEPVEKVFSPYRVCPLGAHVDHQHGLVTGFAIDRGVELWFAPSGDSRIHIQSLTFPGETIFDLQQQIEYKKGNWGDYIRGAVYAMNKRFTLQHGIKGIIKGSLPIGGLSSSAAVLVAYVKALAKVNNLNLTPMETIRITSEAEREYVGLNNGILDQACVVLSEQNSLLYLDTDNNDYQLLPKHYNMPEFELGIFFSGLTRSLIASDYNLRVHECKTAAWNILAFNDLPLNLPEKTFLRDVPEKYFKAARERLPLRFAKRAVHFFSECERVRLGITAWEKGDIFTLGKLIFESCESSIKQYECGSPELITLYEIMRETPGIYGGRFSGAGFKGACISLVEPNLKEEISEQVARKYLEKFPKYKDSFEIHFCKTHQGAEIYQS
ncbi:MAG: galactokinase [Candidatus Symbiothrix sp.]|jgi:galactokinase/galacturonokinase|nr:galactokinase [Candidatus Symbiothrix sp.]